MKRGGWARVVGGLVVVAAFSLGGCGGGGSDLPVCSGGPYFTVLPIPESAIASAGPLGGLNPPSHTTPSDHAGLYVDGTDVPLVAPGDMHIDQLRRTRYLMSPFRQGKQDYALYFHVCRDINGQLGHLQTLRADLESMVRTSDCETYDTADETIEACLTNVDVDVMAGEPLGTVGVPTGGAFDFGVYDASYTNIFANPSRFRGDVLHARCAYEMFPPAQAEVMLSQVGYAGSYRTVEPRCGTVEVDVPGTAAGVWVVEGYVGEVMGDESNAITLTGDNIHPDTTLVLSLGSATLGATLVRVPRETTGRVNRQFADIGPDGTLYCYTSDPAAATTSYLLSLGADMVLTIERVDHAAGASPCSADPATWSFTSASLRYVR